MTNNNSHPLKLLLVDSDPIFRLGLKVALEQVPNLQVVAQAQTYTAALQTLAEAQPDVNKVNLVVLSLCNIHSTPSQQLGLQLCQQLKTQYPKLPLLLLCHIQSPELIFAAKTAGVNGYCPKSIPVSELVFVMRTVASGGFYWFGENGGADSLRASLHPLSQVLSNLRLSGIRYINATLAQVTAKLQVPGLPLLDRVILAGRQRELLAAQRFLNWLLASPPQRKQLFETQHLAYVQLPPAPSVESTPSLISHQSLQVELFSSCVNKLQFNLQNVTDTPLEIDILSNNKKRELFYSILQHLAHALDEIRISQVEINRLDELRSTILIDLWQAATTEFFGKFTRVKVGDRYLEVVSLLLQNSAVVQTQILHKIPLVTELLAYLLFQTDLYIDNILCPAVSIEAKERSSMLLENFLIQVANGVVQPLLNSLADVEEIKQVFFSRNLISTRDIERFRNNLSWKYRLRNIQEAQEIFESRYELFVFAPRGIATFSIYAPRSQELKQLSGIQLFVTLLWEFRDAIAPRLQSLLSFLGSGIVFLLTQVVGRSLGLIARGILQGIGSVSLSNGKNKKF